MSRKSSTFIQETREREGWLAATLEKEGAEPKEREHLLAIAALTRGVFGAVHVPEEAEEQSRARGAEEMQQLRVDRLHQQQPEAPWYLRVGTVMRTVFTLGKRR